MRINEVVKAPLNPQSPEALAQVVIEMCPQFLSGNPLENLFTDILWRGIDIFRAGDPLLQRIPCERRKLIENKSC